MDGTEDILSRQEIDQALLKLSDWHYQLGGLVTVYKAPTSVAALELMAAVGRIAEERNHHPDLDWRYNRVFVRFTSHDAGTAVTARDTDAAAATSVVAASVGASAEPGLYRTVRLVIESTAPGVIEEAWKAALGYRRSGEASLVDAHGRGPAIELVSGAQDVPGSVTVEVHRGADESAKALQKALAAGGSVVAADGPGPEPGTEGEPAPLNSPGMDMLLDDGQGHRIHLCS
ncbi:4a-hydroxytetrahydrobiopterin dehydratase [Arthrobacter sp. M4]|uniref:4a-hydroxytetrahydrobiopterin dehydratase n=1 Tax=Arthrobacter sp. M4 TaxID=218160 RepID=UPI001CDD2601|nr:4a-hydroxytetrahydrobiopterin dehydratase [Arthrobacter sp. M4]MCA4132346.1 4a-hydroxytetrahydrobiopterin dehydratase [Arthrobacter sp. M4]